MSSFPQREGCQGGCWNSVYDLQHPARPFYWALKHVGPALSQSAVKYRWPLGEGFQPPLDLPIGLQPHPQAEEALSGLLTCLTVHFTCMGRINLPGQPGAMCLLISIIGVNERCAWWCISVLVLFANAHTSGYIRVSEAYLCGILVCLSLRVSASIFKSLFVHVGGGASVCLQMCIQIHKSRTLH